MKKPIPSEHYRKQQREAQRLLDNFPGGEGHNAAVSITEELEAEFLDAWGFTPGLDERGLEVKMMAAKTTRAFDHCTWYCDSQTNGHVVATQPYIETAEAVESISQALVVSDRLKPEIIAAPEWAFYYPGQATLVVVKFSPAYENILEAIDRLWSPTAEWSLEHN